MIIKCKNCGKKKVTNISKTKFCNDRCRLEYYRKTANVQEEYYGEEEEEDSPNLNNTKVKE